MEQSPTPTLNTDTLEVIATGYIIRVSTGEVVGHVDDKPEFHVHDEASAEWVLDKMQDVDSEIGRLKAKLAAITDQIDAEVRAYQRKSAWLHGRFGEELKMWAQSQVSDKRRSVRLAYGTIGFRHAPGSLKVLAGRMKDAVEWAKQWCPDAVAIAESVNVTPINEAGLNAPPDLFERTEPGDKFYVKLAGSKE